MTKLELIGQSSLPVHIMDKLRGLWLAVDRLTPIEKRRGKGSRSDTAPSLPRAIRVGRCPVLRERVTLHSKTQFLTWKSWNETNMIYKQRGLTVSKWDLKGWARVKPFQLPKQGGMKSGTTPTSRIIQYAQCIARLEHLANAWVFWISGVSQSWDYDFYLHDIEDCVHNHLQEVHFHEICLPSRSVTRVWAFSLMNVILDFWSTEWFRLPKLYNTPLPSRFQVTALYWAEWSV